MAAYSLHSFSSLETFGSKLKSTCKHLAEQLRSAGQQLAHSFSPKVDVFEGRHDYSVLVEVPGFMPEDIVTKVEGGGMHISMHSPQFNETKSLAGVFKASVYKQFIVFPDDVDSKRVATFFDNGWLIIRLPKRVVPAGHTKTKPPVFGVRMKKIIAQEL